MPRIEHRVEEDDLREWLRAAIEKEGLTLNGSVVRDGEAVTFGLLTSITPSSVHFQVPGFIVPPPILAIAERFEREVSKVKDSARISIRRKLTLQ